MSSNSNGNFRSVIFEIIISKEYLMSYSSATHFRPRFAIVYGVTGNFLLSLDSGLISVRMLDSNPLDCKFSTPEYGSSVPELDVLQKLLVNISLTSFQYSVSEIQLTQLTGGTHVTSVNSTTPCFSSAVLHHLIYINQPVRL